MDCALRTINLWIELHKRYSKKIAGFRADIRFHGRCTKNAYEIGSDINCCSGIINDVCQDNSPENLSRKENIEELVNGINDFGARGTKKTFKYSVDGFLIRSLFTDRSRFG